MLIHVLTLFPGILEGPLNESLILKAREKGILQVETVNIRDFSTDKHNSCDDRPYGGGPGMVMLPGPIYDAVESVQKPDSTLIMMTPQGKKFDQKMAEQLAEKKHLVFICGHYEGIDERVRLGLNPMEVSIGDYVLSNGALSAMVVIDAVARLIPGVLGNNASVTEDTFTRGGLKFPQYTRPAVFRGMEVPEILKSGHHAQIEKWRLEQSRLREQQRD